LDRVSTVVLGLDGSGKAERFADYSQWAAEQAAARKPAKPTKAGETSASPSPPSKKKLSYAENREYETMEQRISVLEDTLEQKRAALEEIAMKEPLRLEQHYKEIEGAQHEVDLLYARWAELEEKTR
jgi:ATP-binding cassette subfamily F protein uup